ncbi:tyrosine-type recombinase/integrase, partial [Gordonia humi]
TRLITNEGSQTSYTTTRDLTHSFRRSYATHLLEAGWDPRFVQDQMGHEHASTTGIYQFTSDQFRQSTLRSALDRTMKQALRSAENGKEKQ